MRFFGYFLVASQESTSPAGASPGKPYVNHGFRLSPKLRNIKSRCWRRGDLSFGATPVHHRGQVGLCLVEFAQTLLAV